MPQRGEKTPSHPERKDAKERKGAKNNWFPGVFADLGASAFSGVGGVLPQAVALDLVGFAFVLLLFAL